MIGADLLASFASTRIRRVEVDRVMLRKGGQGQNLGRKYHGHLKPVPPIIGGTVEISTRILFDYALICYPPLRDYPRERWKARERE